MAEKPEDSVIEEKPSERDEEDKSSETSKDIDEEKPSGREEDKTESPETSKDKGEKPEEEVDTEADLKARYTKTTQELADLKKQNENLAAQIQRLQPPPTIPKTQLDAAIEKHGLQPEAIKDVAAAIQGGIQEQGRVQQNQLLASQIDTILEVQWKDFKGDYPEFPDEKKQEFRDKMNEIAMENPKILNDGNAFEKVLRYKYMEDPKGWKGIVQAVEKRVEERASKKKASALTKLGKDAKPTGEKKTEEEEAADELFGNDKRDY